MEKFKITDFYKGTDDYVLYEDGRLYNTKHKRFICEDDKKRHHIKYGLTIGKKRIKIYPHRILFAIKNGLTKEDIYYLRIKLIGDRNDFSPENYEIKEIKRKNEV